MPLGDTFGLAGKIIDQIRFEEPVGEGGFSVIYRGVHTGLDEPVAVKCLKLPMSMENELVDEFILRFRAECKLCYRLSQGSLGIVRSVTSGTCYSPSGALVPYMALEWLEGHSLGAELRERRARGEKAMSFEDAIALLEPAVQAIAYAHSQGIVHRDIKPGNLHVLPPRDGPRMKVLDFGLAKILHDDSIGRMPSVKTAGNVFFASPSYGAPEQFDPRLGGVGPWTDVYALALVFMEMVAGRKVRHADTMADAVIIALDPKTDLSPRSLGLDVRREVNDVLARATAREPARRPQNAGDFWSQLRDAMLHVAGPTSGFGKTISEDALPARILVEQALAKKAQAEVSGVPTRRERVASMAVPASAHAPPSAQPQTLPLAPPPMGQTLRMENAPVIPLPPPPATSQQRTSSAPAPTPQVQSTPDPRRAPTQKLKRRKPSSSSPLVYVLLTIVAVGVFAGGAWLGHALFSHKQQAGPAPASIDRR
jgi:serine/threonine protein kinase